MNAILPRIHPATLGEAIVRLDKYVRDRMAKAGTSYAQITYGEGSTDTSISDPHKDAQRGFLAIRDLARMIAPALGDQASPQAIEFFPKGVALHLGPLMFGVSSRPAVLIAEDFDASLQVLQRAVLHGDTSPYAVTLDKDQVYIEACDAADAVVRALLLSGYLSGSMSGHSFVFDHNSPGLMDINRKTLKVASHRISQAMSGFQQVAE